MSSSLDHLEKVLRKRCGDLVSERGDFLERIMGRHAAHGRLQSGATIKVFYDECLQRFDNLLAGAAQYAFNLTGRHDEEVSSKLEEFSAQIKATLLCEFEKREPRINAGAIYREHLLKLRDAMDENAALLIDDFGFGMHRNERLKKDPIVSVFASQTNSPGAVQQVGVMENQQEATIQQQPSLMVVIDTMLGSDAFKSLSRDDQIAVRDMADAVKDEAAKSQPDVSKIKRWGQRLATLLSDVGMKVASSAVTQVLTKALGL